MGVKAGRSQNREGRGRGRGGRVDVRQEGREEGRSLGKGHREDESKKQAISRNQGKPQKRQCRIVV